MRGRMRILSLWRGRMRWLQKGWMVRLHARWLTWTQERICFFWRRRSVLKQSGRSTAHVKYGTRERDGIGCTPLFTAEELGGVGVAMALYPLSAFRAMSAAALQAYITYPR